MSILRAHYVKTPNAGSMVYMGNMAAYIQAISGPIGLAWFKGRRPPGAVLHSSNEPVELSQRPYVNNLLLLLHASIVSIMYYYYYLYFRELKHCCFMLLLLLLLLVHNYNYFIIKNVKM